MDIQAQVFGYVQHLEHRGMQQKGVWGQLWLHYLQNIQSNKYNWARNSIGWLQKLPELVEPRLQFIWRKDVKKHLRKIFRLNWLININRSRYEICRGKLKIFGFS